MTAVPRLLEKLYDKIIAKGENLSGIKKKLFFWAVNLGLKYEPYGKNGYLYEIQLFIARKLIFKKWKEALEEIYQPFLLEVLRCNLGLQEFSLLQELQLLGVAVFN